MKLNAVLRVTFFCRSGRTNVKGESAIVMRVTLQKERKDIFTGEYCKIGNWDNNRQRIHSKAKGASDINVNLNEFEHAIKESYNRLWSKELPFTLDDLIDKYKGKEEQAVQLEDYLRKVEKDLGKRVGLNLGKLTFQKYCRVNRFILDFLREEYRIRNFPLVRIDHEFIDGFYQYLRKNREIQNNTAVKYLETFRTLLTPAIRTEQIKRNPFASTSYKIKTVSKGFLSNEEIGLLQTTILSSEDLARIRDQFLFCCFTGLAYSDLKMLTREHIIQSDDQDYYIRKRRKKTDEESIIPLIKAAIAILKKYSRSDDFRDFHWHVSANQKMNQRLKLIGKLCGIKQSLYMHLARHTFATTVTLSKGVTIESVSKMLGHSNLRQTQHYAKITDLKIREEMKKVQSEY